MLTNINRILDKDNTWFSHADVVCVKLRHKIFPFVVTLQSESEAAFATNYYHHGASQITTHMTQLKRHNNWNI